MTEQNEIYAKKIKELLNKPLEQVSIEPVCPIKQKIKEHGIKKVISAVFTESYEIPQFVTEDESEQLENSEYFKILKKSAYPDAHSYWNDLIQKLNTVGKKVVHHESKYEKLKVLHDEKDITFTLVRNSAIGDTPRILVEYSGDAQDVIKLIENSGLICNRLTAKQLNSNSLILEITK